MALSTIPFSGLGADASNQGVNFRNLIINGDMSIAQRGTSTSSISNNTLYPCSDRFQFQNGYLGTWTASQDTNVPTGQGFSKSFKIACTTADASPATGDALNVSQKIEGQNLQQLKFGTSNAESLTVSFWVKCNKTGNGQVNLINFDANRIISNTYTINAVDTWEKKTITFSGDTTGSIDNDNGASLFLEWYLDSGTDFSSGTMQTSWTSRSNTDRNAGTTLSLGDSTSNYWQVTGVQLEVGTSASDFEFLPYDVNLERCLRYFEKSFNQGTTPANGVIVNVFFGRRGNIFFKKTKRTNPTIAPFSPLNSNNTWQWYSGVFNSVTPIFGISNTLFSYDLGGYEYTDVYGAWTADAEL
jgi:hypothetical protein